MYDAVLVMFSFYLAMLAIGLAMLTYFQSAVNVIGISAAILFILSVACLLFANRLK